MNHPSSESIVSNCDSLSTAGLALSKEKKCSHALGYESIASTGLPMNDRLRRRGPAKSLREQFQDDSLDIRIAIDMPRLDGVASLRTHQCRAMLRTGGRRPVGPLHQRRIERNALRRGIKEKFDRVVTRLPVCTTAPTTPLS